MCFRYQAGIQFRFGGGTPPPPPNRSPVASCSASPAQVISGSGDTVMVRAEATDPDNDPHSLHSPQGMLRVGHS